MVSIALPSPPNRLSQKLSTQPAEVKAGALVDRAAASPLLAMSASQPFRTFANVRFRPIVDVRLRRQTVRMGRRSGVPHTDGELAKLNRQELEAELRRSRLRLTFAGSAKMAKQWHKRIHWLEGALTQRE